MKAGQLDAFLIAMGKLLAIKWKGTGAKQIPVNCMKHSARNKAVVYITLQNVLKTEVIKYINLHGHPVRVPREGGERFTPAAVDPTVGPSSLPTGSTGLPRQLQLAAPAPLALLEAALAASGSGSPGLLSSLGVGGGLDRG